MTETWLPVVGHEGSHEISDLGNIRSVDRIVLFPDGRKRFSKGRVLKTWQSNGYPYIKLGGTGRRNSPIHTLVLEAFSGPRPEGWVACHADGDRGNPKAENLRWGTYSDNNNDLVRHGTHAHAKKTECPQGHAYTPENTYMYVGPKVRHRQCRQCQKDYSTSEVRRQKRRERAALVGWKAA